MYNQFMIQKYFLIIGALSKPPKDILQIIYIDEQLPSFHI
jgi:hypothetical protein